MDRTKLIIFFLNSTYRQLQYHFSMVRNLAFIVMVHDPVTDYTAMVLVVFITPFTIMLGSQQARQRM
jgi:hypothetical protein